MIVDVVIWLAALEMEMLRTAPLIWLPFRLIAPPLLVALIRKVAR